MNALPIALRARQSQTKHLLLPDENAKEAAVVSDINVYPVTDLRNAVEIIAGIRSENPPEALRVDPELGRTGADQAHRTLRIGERHERAVGPAFAW